MRRIAIGLVAGVAVWVGSAVAAEAQTIQIQPIGPTALKCTDVTATVVSDITPNSPSNVYYRVEIFVNGQWKMNTVVSGFTTTGTKRVYKSVVLTGLGLHAGDVVVFRTECGWNPTQFSYYADLPPIAVTGS